MRRSKFSFKYILKNGMLKREASQKGFQDTGENGNNAPKKRKLGQSKTPDQLGASANSLNGNGRKSVEMNPLRSSVDPLNIDIILALIFDFCSVETLKTCRLVSHRWRNLSMKAWRNKGVLCLGSGSLKTMNAEGVGKLREYLKLLQYKRDALQLKRYLLKVSRVPWEEEPVKPVLDTTRRVTISKSFDSRFLKFLVNFYSLHTLELENYEWPHEVNGPIITSNLKRLKIFRNAMSNSTGRTSNWESLLKCFPMLETLVIEYRPPRECIDEVLKILTVAQTIRAAEGEVVMSLKEFEVTHLPQTLPPITDQCQNNGNIIDFIVQSKFPLERLAVHLIWGKEDLRNEMLPIFRLLDSSKEKLQYLHASFNFDVDNITPLNLSEYLGREKVNSFTLCMESLKEVRLRNGLWGFYILANLELPQLEKLIFDAGESSKKMSGLDVDQFKLPIPRKMVYENLDTLEFLDKGRIPGPEIIKVFAKMMPYVVRLTIPLDKNTFIIVCQHLRGLKMLNATAAQHQYDELDDESLTGISKKDGPEGTRNSNITDLVMLTELSIDCGSEGLKKKSGFTDHSVMYGFLQLPQLHHLNVTFSEISEDVRAKLMDHVRGNLTIKVKAKPKYKIRCA